MTSERRLAAIMFTDLVGFSALTQQNEALALELIDTKKQLLNPLLEQHKGSLIKTMGDGFLVEFSSALQAVQCAMGIQAMLQGYNSSQASERKINLRIGIHLGDVEFKDGDVYGDGVNIASRIEPLAEPGGICVSEDVARQVRNKADVKLESLGTPELKNIDESFEVFRLMMPVAVSAASDKQDLSKSIAVLPFDNMSTEPDNEFFSDGLTEDILTKLSKVRDLKVISRTSVMQYKGVKRNLREIAGELGVGVVVEGSVRRAGDQVRVTAQLIQAETDEHLWAETYDRKLENIFDVQSDVAEKIVEALQASISDEEQKLIQSQQTENSAAYELYLRGLQLWNARTKESISEAILLFEEALKLDPNYALAKVGLANAHLLLGGSRNAHMRGAHKLAKELTDQALDLDPNLGEAYSTLGQLEMTVNWDAKKAEQNFKQALSLNPNDSTAYHWYGNMLDLSSRSEEGLILLEKAVELDPLSVPARGNYSLCLLRLGQIERAKEELEIAENLPSGGWLWIFWWLIYYRETREFREGLEFISRIRNSKFDNPRFILDEAIFRLGLGQRERALELYVDYSYSDIETGPFEYMTQVCFLIELDRKEQALDVLWKAYEEQSRLMIYLYVGQIYNFLNDEPRFQELINKVGWGLD